MKDYYQVLEISSDATEEEIKKQYRKLAKFYHPDQNRHSNERADYAAKKFMEISEAYETLNDPIKKATYDRNNKGNVRHEKLRVHPSIIDFGTVSIGEDSTKSFIVNYPFHSDNIELNYSETNPWFIITPETKNLSSENLSIEFKVQACTSNLKEGSYSGWIEIIINGERVIVNLIIIVQAKAKLFIFKSGETLNEPDELVKLCDRYWDEAKAYLYDDRAFKSWFAEIHRNDLIDKLNESRKEHNRDIGLEKFLLSIDPSSRDPLIEITPDKTHINDFNLLTSNNSIFKVEISNQGRGCCYGTLKIENASWLRVPYSEFAVTSGRSGEINLQINVQDLIWESKYPKAQLNITTNSSNIKSKVIDFSLTTSRHPKLAEIESLRDQGRWRSAQKELDNFAYHDKRSDTLKQSISNIKATIIFVTIFETIVLYGLCGQFLLNSNIDIPLMLVNNKLFLSILTLISGPVGAVIYLLKWGGRNGFTVDFIFSNLIGLALVIAFILSILIVIFVIIIIVLFIFIGGG